VKKFSRRRGLWIVLLALAAFAVPAARAHARVRHNEAWAREHFATAERLREALNGRPPADRSRHDYQRALNAYRSVYMGAPASSKADPSAVAVAEILVEMGRRFDDDKILHEAIDQYKFLRREYPGSRYRFDGLFTIGEIYKDDLNDPERARATFQDFLKRYPHSHLAADARQAIAEIDRQAQAYKAAAQSAEKRTSAKNKNAKNDSAKNANAKDLNAKNVGDNNVGGNKDDADEGYPSADVSTSVAPAKSESPQPRSEHVARVTGLRHWSTPDYTRVAIDVESDVKFESRRIDSPSRIFFDLRDTKLASTLVGKSFDVDDGFLKKVRLAQSAPGQTRVVLEIDSLSDYDAFMLPDPYRLIIDIHGKTGYTKHNSEADKNTVAAAAPVAPNPAAKTSTQKPVVKKIVPADDDDDDRDMAAAEVTKRDVEHAKKAAPKAGEHWLASGKPENDPPAGIREARPTASGDRSLTRVLGLKIGKIVIDAGHGGHDTGTIGPNGLEEKDLVLEVARRLGKMLETRLGAEVVYTRKDDTFVPLETRTAIANQARADLFVSIHANSSHDPDARGVETYYLNFTSSPEALEVAARENAVSEKSIFELQDLVKKIALKEKIEESREFAGDVQESLHDGLAAKSAGIRDRGVKKAPFIVLIGANMPSILAEISFVSNPADEHRLATSEYRQRIADSLYRGIEKYVDGLSGVKVASKMDKTAGQ
jgi:N-acetylmuramoyl-L-alanine amidase